MPLTNLVFMLTFSSISSTSVHTWQVEHAADQPGVHVDPLQHLLHLARLQELVPVVRSHRQQPLQEILVKDPMTILQDPAQQCCGTGTVGTVPFCRSGTGTETVINYEP